MNLTKENAIPPIKNDKIIIRSCIDGLIQYAAQLRQTGSDGCQRTPELRFLVECLGNYWGLDAESGPAVDYLQIFDKTMNAADAAPEPWKPKDQQKGITVFGLYRYAIDMIYSQGLDALPYVIGCKKQIQEIERFWDFSSPMLDNMYIDIDSTLKERAMHEINFTLDHTESGFIMGGM